MVYVIVSPRRAGKLAEMQQLMEAVEKLAETMRKELDPPTLSADLLDEADEEDMTERDVIPNGECFSSCISPSLPKHQISWFTSGFQ